MWLEAFLGAFIGAVLSLVISILIELQRKPKLSFRIETPPIDYFYNDQSLPAKRARYLRVQLWNNEMPKIFKWLNRESAIHCNADLQIFHYDDQSLVFNKRIPARWAGSDEPFSPQFDPQTNKIIQIFDPSKYNAAFRRDCHPGTKETIDIAARFDEDEDCYVWNNDYSIKGWRNSELKLARGRYYVIVTVYSSGEKINGFFKIENSVSISDFRLLDINDEEKTALLKKTNKGGSLFI